MTVPDRTVTGTEQPIPGGFVPPPYPYDRLAPIAELARKNFGQAIDLSVGTPFDPPPKSVIDALCSTSTVRGYPPSIGRQDFRAAVADWFASRLNVEVPTKNVAACIGTKEFVTGLPHLLKLRDPRRDTILYPAISYPSYEMGAILAGCRAVAVPVAADWSLDLSGISDSDAERALCLWSNTPANPSGGLDDLAVVAQWGRDHQVPVFSDECYIEFTWTAQLPSGGGKAGIEAISDAVSVVHSDAKSGRLPGRSILESGLDGVVAVHSLSKRSNFAGMRVGYYAGDEELIHYLSEMRKHQGLMVPGPAQDAGIAALGDQQHVLEQRDRYLSRLRKLAGVMESLGLVAPLPGGGFYLWVAAPDQDAWALTERLARELGIVVSPGEFYGEQGSGHVRIAAVQPDDQVELVAARVGA
ncbi:MAG TPA: aminotransferase class I/II-fold pyridoxal phosphate-dependent enzyme [Microthrixaceae bacterium]|nr:aminotransferase class I/II-fold pyridoxal phosphate-dependent enzyme [Microthrixaceae bacterium]